MKPRAATGASGRPEKDAGDGAVVVTLFTIITELLFILKSKLLPNLHNNSKISKNKSCSKFKVLQLCFYNHPLIRSTFWSANLNSKGDTLSTFRLFKLLQFFLNNLENSKTNFVQLNKLYIFALRLNPKMYFDLELGFSGQNLSLEIRVFENLNQYNCFEIDSTIQGNTDNINVNLVLVYAYQSFH